LILHQVAPDRSRVVREPDGQASPLAKLASYSAQFVTLCRCLRMW
jgi:hypothetical protein